MSKKTMAFLGIGFLATLIFGMLLGGLSVRSFFTPNPQVIEREFETTKIVSDETYLRGVVILKVLEGSPAAQAGLEPGDQIISVNKKALNQDASLAKLIQSFDVGDDIEIVINRAGQEISFLVELGEHPKDTDLPYLGVVVTPYAKGPMARGFSRGQFDDHHHGFRHHDEYPFHHPEFRHHDDESLYPPGFPFNGNGLGLLVMHVAENSPAEGAGLQAGDVILALDEEEITGFEQLADLVGTYEAGDMVILQISRAGEEMEFEITLTEHPEVADRAYLGVMGFGFQEMMPEGMRPHFDFESQG